MPNAKKFIGYTTTAKVVYGIIERQIDLFRLNDADGAFAAAPVDPYISFTEHSVIKGEYDLSESRTAWNNGLYKCTMYEQAGANPVPAADMVIAYQYMYIISDAEVIAEMGLTVGTGDTVVNHDTGGVDNLRAVTVGGAGIDAVIINAYLKTEYDAGSRIVRGSSLTKSDGRWLYDMMLSTGLTYTFIFYKEAAYGPNSKEVTI